ncbi:MAG: hypothetical protein RLZ98_2513 [Pseudomonadota bacterium]|jgi:hypothetical protein
MVQAPLIGIATGLVSALLFVSVSSGTLLGVMVLFFLAPMPIAIAGLGWGATAALAAAVTGSLAIVLLATSPSPALFYALTIAAPMAAASYLLMLSRQVTSEDPDRTIVLEWYPIGRLVAYATAWAAFLAALALFSTGADLEALRETLRTTFDRMTTADGPLAPSMKRPLTEQEKNDFVNLMVATLPGALATIWFIAAMINLWLAGHATRISGRLMRPWPDFAALSLPPAMRIVFALAVAATFLLAGLPQLIASGFAFAIMMAYVLVGLAIVHWTTRGLTARPAIITATYLSLIVLNPFSGLLLALVGLAEPVSPLHRRPAPDPATQDKT